MDYSDSSEDERPYNPRDDLEVENDEDSLRPNKRRKTKGSTTLRTRGLAFVQTTAESEDNEDTLDDQDEDEGEYRPTMGLGMGMGGRAQQGLGLGAYNQRTRSPSPDRRSTPESEQQIGAGESAFGKGGKLNTNSFAARMMAKMGHKAGQGLGKAGQGIAAPIEAQKVQAGSGLGFGQDEQRPRPSTSKKKAELLPGQVPAPRLKAPSRKKYEIQAIESRGLHVPESLRNIVDATGAEHRRLDDISGYSTPTGEAPRVLTDEDRQQIRLKQNLNLFADAWDGQIAQAEALQQEKLQQEAEAKRYAGQAEVFESLLVKFERVAVDDSAQARSFDQAVASLREIQDSYQSYIKPLDLSDLAVATLLQPLQILLTDWDPAHDTELAIKVVTQMQAVSTIIDLPKTTSSHRRRRTTPLESLLLQTIYPQVRNYLRTTWHPYDPLPAIDLLNILHPSLLPAWMIYNLVQETIIPRLLEKLRKYKSTSTKSPPLHEWLFDWWTLFETLDPPAFHTLRVEIKSKIRFNESQWPKWEPLLGSRKKSLPQKVIDLTDSTPSTPINLEEITFRDIFEEWCAENELILKNTGAADVLGRRLQRLQLAGGKSQGLLIYVQDDVVFEAGTGNPYGLDEDLLSRVTAGK